MNDRLITNLLQRLDEKVAAYDLFDKHYRGESPLSYLSPEARTALGNRLQRVSVNLPRVLVDAVAERLRVTGFTGTADDPGLWADWLSNDLDQQAPVCHREALSLGDGYVIVWADKAGAPSVSVESAKQVAMITDPGSRRVLAAVKRWTTPTGTEAVIYEPDTVTRLHSDAIGATTLGFKITETIPNPLGWTPVVRFRNGSRLLDDGVSEMADVIPLSDAVTKITTDMLVGSEYGARPRRWATGLELEEDDDGNAVSPIAEGDRLMINEHAEGKFGQLPGSDLAGYDKAIGVLMRQVAAVSGLPDHLLGIGGDNPSSADAIRASEAALTAKAEARQQTFGRQWEQVARLMVAVRHGVDPDRVAVRVTWADPSTRSAAQEADAIVKLHTAGLLPATYALRRLGYDDDEITAIRAARRAEALDQAASTL